MVFLEDTLDEAQTENAEWEEKCLVITQILAIRKSQIL